MKTRVKICGITREVDAEAAIASGASALGFVFWPESPRAVTAAAAARLAPDAVFVARVGVFVDAAPEDVASVVRAARLDAVQLHGDELVARYAACGAPIIKAVSLDAEDDVARALALPPEVIVLVDASDRTLRGGTGVLANWDLARQVAARRPIMLAGGLRPENIGEAVRRVHPWAVDVSSGVESSPGRKDSGRVAAVIRAAIEADVEGE